MTGNAVVNHFEYLAACAFASAFFQQAGFFEILPMITQSCYYIFYTLVFVRDRSFDRWTPVLSFAQIEHHFDLNIQTICAVAITFIDDKYVTDFKDTSLDCLNIVAKSGYEHNKCGIRILNDIDFGLSYAYCFDENYIETESIHQFNRICGLAGQTPETAACTHTTDINTLIQRQVVHTNTVTKNGAAGERTGRIDSDDAYCFTLFAKLLYEGIRQCALTRTRRTSDTDDLSTTGMVIDIFHDIFITITFVFNDGNCSR